MCGIKVNPRMQPRRERRIQGYADRQVKGKGEPQRCRDTAPDIRLRQGGADGSGCGDIGRACGNGAEHGHGRHIHTRCVGKRYAKRAMH